ncbi:signal peptidase I [Blastomonas sp.]|uniref:signal peptidase I n=1 Tax=Blastomonas sp. TaxID=1909299 RepID=UPI00260CEF19|nr:signal peptidase I [Blastomonas sp.]MDM7955365.1 signal peptidase I [Blastomonas sp.]
MAPEASDAAIEADTARHRPADEEHKPINWFEEIRGLFLLLLAVLAFHSLVAKPFYIPTMSMMPNLLVGDRLVVSKYPYGWSWVSVSFHLLPPMKGRIMGSTPEYGDIVIATPQGASADYIKRVIGRPGDTIEVRSGRVILNGEEVVRSVQPNMLLPVDINSPCNASDFPMLKMRGADGKFYCELPIIRETLPNGVSYNTIDLGPDYPLDNYGPYTVPAGHIFLMGDNRDRSADSRATREELGLGGAVPLENIGGRAEIVTFSLDGSTNWNPVSWWESLRGERAGTSLRADKD